MNPDHDPECKMGIIQDSRTIFNERANKIYAQLESLCFFQKYFQIHATYKDFRLQQNQVVVHISWKTIVC